MLFLERTLRLAAGSTVSQHRPCSSYGEEIFPFYARLQRTGGSKRPSGEDSKQLLFRKRTKFAQGAPTYRFEICGRAHCSYRYEKNQAKIVKQINSVHRKFLADEAKKKAEAERKLNGRKRQVEIRNVATVKKMRGSARHRRWTRRPVRSHRQALDHVESDERLSAAQYSNSRQTGHDSVLVPAKSPGPTVP